MSRDAPQPAGRERAAPGTDRAHDEGVERPGATLSRLLRWSRPYLALLLVAFACTVVFSAGRYGRAYLTKPLLDGVLIPVVADGDRAPAGAATGPLPAAATPRPESESPSSPLRRVAEWLAPGSIEAPGTRAEAIAKTGRGASDPGGQARPPVATALAELLFAALLIVLVTPLSLFGRAYLTEYVLARISVDLKRDVARKLLAMPLAAHVDARSGDTLTRALDDTGGAAAALDLVFQEILLGLTMLVIGVATLLYISIPLTLISLLAAPPVAWAVAGFGRRIRRGASARQSQLGEVTGRLLAMLRGIKVMKAFGAEGDETRAFEHETGRLFRHDMRVVRSRVLSRALVEALNSAAGIGVLLVGTGLVLRGRFGLTTGDVAAFATVLATTYKPVKNLAKAHGRLMERLVSAHRFFALLDAPEEPKDEADARPLPTGPLSIRFDDVVFTHAGDAGDAAFEPPLIDGVTFELAPGEVVALVGASGAGKTTLVDLLMRFYDIAGGRVEVGGVDVRRLNRRSLRGAIAYVGQEPFLFDASVRENVRYGRPDASETEIAAALRDARVDDFVRDLPAGADTRVGEFGLRLSGGQRQRIAVARALLRDARIFVFDEATSALDVETERLVQDAIERLRGDRIVLVVAHRTSTIRRADRVLLLDGGRIVDDGPVAAVAARSARFREVAGLSRDELSRDDLTSGGRPFPAPRAART